MRLMNSFFAVLLIAFAATQVAAQHNPTKKFDFNESVDVPEVGQQILFNRASMWVHDALRENDARVMIQDKTSGTIYGEANLKSSESREIVKFSFSIKVSTAGYLYVLNNYYSPSGDLNKTKPNCCLSERQWGKLRTWANNQSVLLVRSLKDAMKTKTATEDFLTIPLIDSSNRGSSNKMPNVQELPKQRPSLIHKGSYDYAPIAYGTTTSGGFGRHGSSGSSFTPSSASPVSGYRVSAGLYLPNRLDPAKGWTINAGMLEFPLTIKGSTISYATGTGVAVPNNTTTSVSYVELAPQYTINKKMHGGSALVFSIGADLGITTTQNMKNMIGPDFEFSYGKNGIFFTAKGDYTLGNIYGSNSGSGFRQGGNSGLTVQPLFVGAGLTLRPSQNKWIKSHVGGK